VSFARGLYERFRHLIHEFAKFGVVGGISFVVTFAGTGILDKKAGLGIVAGSTIATIVATCVSYVGNRYWTFRHRARTGMTRETILFFALNGIGLLIQEACILFSKHVLGLSGTLQDYAALVVGVGLATIFRFWSYRRYVWLAVSAPAGPGERAAGGPGGRPAGRPEGRPAGRPEGRPAGRPEGRPAGSSEGLAAGALPAGPEKLEPATVPPAPFPHGGTRGAAGDDAGRSR
jgi:putative flippase GtrA